jgi:hypothetical protein
VIGADHNILERGRGEKFPQSMEGTEGDRLVIGRSEELDHAVAPMSTSPSCHELGDSRSG